MQDLLNLELNSLQRRVLRQLAGATPRVPVWIVRGGQSPTLRGRAGYYTTPAGNVVHFPSAYRRAYGRPDYHSSSRHVAVGHCWLRKFLGLPYPARHPVTTPRGLRALELVTILAKEV